MYHYPYRKYRVPLNKPRDVDGQSKFYTFGSWHIPYKQTNVLCSDGRSRVVWFNGQEPDTYFSQPGKVYVKGKAVTGFVSYDFESDRWVFMAYSYRKNGHLLP